MNSLFQDQHKLNILALPGPFAFLSSCCHQTPSPINSLDQKRCSCILMLPGMNLMHEYLIVANKTIAHTRFLLCFCGRHSRRGRVRQDTQCGAQHMNNFFGRQSDHSPSKLHIILQESYGFGDRSQLLLLVKSLTALT